MAATGWLPWAVRSDDSDHSQPAAMHLSDARLDARGVLREGRIGENGQSARHIVRVGGLSGQRSHRDEGADPLEGDQLPNVATLLRAGAAAAHEPQQLRVLFSPAQLQLPTHSRRHGIREPQRRRWVWHRGLRLGLALWAQPLAFRRRHEGRLPQDLLLHPPGALSVPEDEPIPES